VVKATSLIDKKQKTIYDRGRPVTNSIQTELMAEGSRVEAAPTHVLLSFCVGFMQAHCPGSRKLYLTGFTVGIFQLPSIIDEAFSLGQQSRSFSSNLSCAAGATPMMLLTQLLRWASMSPFTPWFSGR
jgi:hypothetical protein